MSVGPVKRSCFRGFRRIQFTPETAQCTSEIRHYRGRTGVVGGFEFLLFLVDFKSVLALSTFVTVRVRRYRTVFPRVALGAHFAAL